MPFLLIPMLLVLTTVSADSPAIGGQGPAGAEARAESPTFDPDRPPSWWLTKMRRPCAKVASRVSC